MPTDTSKTATATSGSTKLTSPPGFLVHPNLDEPDRRFDPAGQFTAGIHLTVAELTSVEDDLNRVFRDAYPGDTTLPHLPFRRHPDGPLTLHGKSAKRPRIVNEAFKPVIGARAGDRVRLIGFARPYRFDGRAGVSLFLTHVQVIALEARDPRRERAKLEQEALRQAAAMARTRIGGR